MRQIDKIYYYDNNQQIKGEFNDDIGGVNMTW